MAARIVEHQAHGKVFPPARMPANPLNRKKHSTNGGMCQIYSFASFLNAKKKIYIEFALYKRLRVLYNSFR